MQLKLFVVPIKKVSEAKAEMNGFLEMLTAEFRHRFIEH
jgi:hypothetical protein